MIRPLCAVALVALAATDVASQQPQAVVVPSTITVGDVFHAAVRMELPDNAGLVAPDSLALDGDLEQAGRRTIRIDTTSTGRLVTVAYPITAWRPGPYELPPLTLRVTRDNAARDSIVNVSLPSFEVTSVLPVDTAGIEPKPARDVMGANRLWWLILLIALLIALIITALIIWWRRRRTAEEPVEIAPPVPPREAALAQLDALRREGLLERGEFDEFYERMTETLRHYAAAVDDNWSTDLTTSELAILLRREIALTDAIELTRILAAADMVKFARAVPTRDAAVNDLDAARTWVDRFEPPVPEVVAADVDDMRAA